MNLEKMKTDFIGPYYTQTETGFTGSLKLSAQYVRENYEGQIPAQASRLESDESVTALIYNQTCIRHACEGGYMWFITRRWDNGTRDALGHASTNKP